MATTVDASRYGDLCRLCAAKTSLVLGINIFESEGSVRQVRKKIENCLPVQIHHEDALPKMICQSCLYKLDMLVDFRERSLRTEKLLLDLVKELMTEKEQQGSLDVIPLDHNGLIMMPHHLLDGHVQNVEIDLAHLNQRDDIIVSHGIILAHQHNVNLDLGSHSLANLELNHHDLAGQDLSNHSLHAQETMLMENTSHNLHPNQFTGGELDMIQHQQQILQEQFGLRHDLDMGNLEIGGVNQENNVVLLHKDKNGNFNDNKKILGHLSYHPTENPKIDHQLQSLTCDSSRDSVKMESLSHHDDSNSTENLLINDRLVNDMDKVYLLPEHNDVLERNNVNSNDCVFCNICGSAFPNEETLDKHYPTHFHKCPSCLDVFATVDILNSHIKDCHITVLNQESQQNHQEKTEQIEPIKTRLKRAIKAPNGIEEDDRDFENEINNGILSNISEVEPKIIEEKPKAVGNQQQNKKCTLKVCTECGNTYKTNYKLNEHMRKHTGERPYKCSSCEKSFRSKIGLVQHEAKHTGQYEFSCVTCGKGFQCRSYLMVHQRVHSDIKPWPCSTCGVNFKTKQSLLDHTNRHLGVKPYMCEICGRGFITKGLCKAHQKLHTGLDNRKYSCKICQKKFVSKSYLQTHLKIHTGEKPFICEVCGKGFITRVDLRIHSTLHTGEKKYICEICGKAFARRDALRCHRRSHTGERPYSCEICGQAFTQFTPMAIHKRLHTGERPYSCEVCAKTFVSRSTMMAHAKKHVT